MVTLNYLQFFLQSLSPQDPNQDTIYSTIDNVPVSEVKSPAGGAIYSIIYNTVGPHWQQQWEQHKNTDQEKQNQQECHHTLSHFLKLVLINLLMGCKPNILYSNTLYFQKNLYEQIWK